MILTMKVISNAIKICSELNFKKNPQTIKKNTVQFEEKAVAN